ncbi:hypothetical protein Droror1_Dr00016545 [Drosera rotundifolia]
MEQWTRLSSRTLRALDTKNPELQTFPSYDSIIRFHHSCAENDFGRFYRYTEGKAISAILEIEDEKDATEIKQVEVTMKLKFKDDDGECINERKAAYRKEIDHNVRLDLHCPAEVFLSPYDADSFDIGVDIHLLYRWELSKPPEFFLKLYQDPIPRLPSTDPVGDWIYLGDSEIDQLRHLLLWQNDRAFIMSLPDNGLLERLTSRECEAFRVASTYVLRTGESFMGIQLRLHKLWRGENVRRCRCVIVYLEGVSGYTSTDGVLRVFFRCWGSALKFLIMKEDEDQ